MQHEQHDFVSCEKQLRELLTSEHLDSSSSDVLFERLDDYIGAATESQMDPDLVSACFARLRELHPEKPRYNTDAGLTRLINSVESQREERNKKINRSSRFISILVAVLALLIVAATALGVNPFEHLFRFAETVSFRLSPSGEMVLSPEIESEYHSLQEALDINGLDVRLPQWIPPEFSLSYVNTDTSEKAFIITAIFTSDEKKFQIDITSHTHEALIIYEKEVGGEVYQSNGQSYYFIPNLNNFIVSWNESRCSILMSGQITEAQARHIVDSIN